GDDVRPGQPGHCRGSVTRKAPPGSCRGCCRSLAVCADHATCVTPAHPVWQQARRRTARPSTSAKEADMTEFLDVPGGGIAYDVTGTGRLPTPAAAAQLPDVKYPALLIVGMLDPDLADPGAEGDPVVAAMPAGAGTVAMVDGAGHYPHAQSPEAVAELVI